VLTARHCVPFVGGMFVGQRNSIGGTQELSVPEAARYAQTDTCENGLVKDFAVMRVDGEFLEGSGRLWPGAKTAFASQIIDVYGYGTTGWPADPNHGLLPVDTTNQACGYVLKVNSLGQRITNGDSGGPGYFLSSGINYISGITNAVAPGGGTQSATYTVRNFVDNKMFSAPQSLGGALVSAPAVAGFGNGVMAFGLASDGKIYINQKTVMAHNGAWSGWAWNLTPPATPLQGDPAAVERSNGDISVLARSTDGKIWERVRQANGNWTAWVQVGPGGSCTSPPSALRFGASVHVFCQASDGNVWRNTSSASLSWQGWGMIMTPPPGKVMTADPPAVVDDGQGKLHHFVRVTDNSIWGIVFNTGTGIWGSWFAMGGATNYGPAASSSGDGRVDVFATGTNGQLYHSVFDPTRWDDGWMLVQNSSVGNSKPTAFSSLFRDKRIDVLGKRSSDSAPWYQQFAY
jgi:hypothetical protein